MKFIGHEHCAVVASTSRSSCSYVLIGAWLQFCNCLVSLVLEEQMSKVLLNWVIWKFYFLRCEVVQSIHVLGG